MLTMGFRSCLRLFFPFPFELCTAPDATFFALSIACFLRLSLPFELIADDAAGMVRDYCICGTSSVGKQASATFGWFGKGVTSLDGLVETRGWRCGLRLLHMNKSRPAPSTPARW